MDVDMSRRKEDAQKNLTDLKDAVSAARAELFTAIHALTDMLQAIALTDTEKQTGVATEANHTERDDKTSEGGLTIYDQSTLPSSQPSDSKAGENTDDRSQSQQKPGLRKQATPSQHGQAQAIPEHQSQQQGQLTHQQHLQHSQPLPTHGQPQQKQSPSSQPAQGLQLQNSHQHDSRQMAYQQGQQIMHQGDRQSRASSAQGGQPSQTDKPQSQNSAMDQQSKSSNQHPEDVQTNQHASQNSQTHIDPPSEQDDRKPSLRPVVAHLRKLRVAVNMAVRLYDAQLAEARKQEDIVPEQERTALSTKRAALIEEVRSKNEKLKALIDQLRELYRASLTIRNNGSVYFNKTSGSMS